MEKSDIKLLYHSFDQPLNPQEEKRLEEALSTNEELRSESQKLQKLRGLLKNYSPPPFSADFGQKVLSKVLSQTEIVQMITYRELKRAFSQYSAVAAILFVLLSAYNVIDLGEFSVEAFLGFGTPTLEAVYVPEKLLTIEGD